LLQIARAALLEKLSAGAGADPRATPPADPANTAEAPPPLLRSLAPDLAEDTELNVPAGCFVSLHERFSHRLRGCVGRIDPQSPLWEAVLQTAGDVLADPRFAGSAAVTIDEVAELVIEVSVLSAPRLAASAEDFRLVEEGVYLVVGKRAGFFLPQVARETGWTREQLLDRLCTEKLGLPADAWQQPGATLYAFEVEVVGPEPV